MAASFCFVYIGGKYHECINNNNLSFRMARRSPERRSECKVRVCPGQMRLKRIVMGYTSGGACSPPHLRQKAQRVQGWSACRNSGTHSRGGSTPFSATKLFFFEL